MPCSSKVPGGLGGAASPGPVQPRAPSHQHLPPIGSRSRPRYLLGHRSVFCHPVPLARFHPPSPALTGSGRRGWSAGAGASGGERLRGGGSSRPSCRHGRCGGAGTPLAVTFDRGARRTTRRGPRGEADALGTCPGPRAPSPGTFRGPPRSPPLPLLRLCAPAPPRWLLPRPRPVRAERTRRCRRAQEPSPEPSCGGRRPGRRRVSGAAAGEGSERASGGSAGPRGAAAVVGRFRHPPRLRWGLAAVRPRGCVPALGREQEGQGDGPGVRRRESGERGGVSGDGPSAPSPGARRSPAGSEGQAASPRPCPRRSERAARGRRVPALGPGQGGAGLPAARPVELLGPCRAPGAGWTSIFCGCAGAAGPGSGQGKAARRREAAGAEAGAVGPGCRCAPGNNQNSSGVSYSQVCAGRPGLEGSSSPGCKGAQKAPALSSSKTTGGKWRARPERAGGRRSGGLGWAGPGGRWAEGQPSSATPLLCSNLWVGGSARRPAG